MICITAVSSSYMTTWRFYNTKIYSVANCKLVRVRNVGDFEISSYPRQDITHKNSRLLMRLLVSF